MAPGGGGGGGGERTISSCMEAVASGGISGRAPSCATLKATC